MKWAMLTLAVVMILVVMLLPAQCHARGFFSFFNPEVSTPVNVQPVNSDISGMKTTITLGSLGSMIWPTEHLIILAFCFLLYAALRRLGSDYHQRNYLVKAQRISSRLERWRERFRSKGKKTIINTEPIRMFGQEEPKTITMHLDASDFREVIKVAEDKIDQLRSLIVETEVREKRAEAAGKKKETR